MLRNLPMDTDHKIQTQKPVLFLLNQCASRKCSLSWSPYYIPNLPLKQTFPQRLLNQNTQQSIHTERDLKKTESLDPYSIDEKTYCVFNLAERRQMLEFKSWSSNL